jgi:hypothetical protein
MARDVSLINATKRWKHVIGHAIWTMSANVDARRNVMKYIVISEEVV